MALSLEDAVKFATDLAAELIDGEIPDDHLEEAHRMIRSLAALAQVQYLNNIGNQLASAVSSLYNVQASLASLNSINTTMQGGGVAVKPAPQYKGGVAEPLPVRDSHDRP